MLYIGDTKYRVNRGTISLMVNGFKDVLYFNIVRER